eukprot:CAMPEP_0178497212 /NCGR_PEP_ID=MMETSP0696-20121128/14559_1 /TAXON_ID=265572 /ORGANISM="Extubocellulus spinifer, Strain CCMP396" /LENGTH=249 /DNA_ID=CAMNT_0020125605 /DNA_START=14 /DNA_END=763 /DNA_ORIENTATION=+
MTNCRIDLTGQQGGACASDPIRISRVQPAAMANYMSSAAWTSFCDKVDDALKPLDQVRRISRLTFVAFFALFLVFMILPILTISSDPSSGMNFPFIGFIIGPLLLMAGMIGMQCYAKQKSTNALKGLEAVCEDISKQYSQLSFHVRFDYILYVVKAADITAISTIVNNGPHTMTTNYIEVSVADVEAASAVPTYGDGGLGAPSAPPLVTASLAGEEKSAAERLRDLDEIRGMLSQEEYDRKRKEILDSV